MTDPTPTRRFSLTPASLIYGLLVVEGLLWLSERYRWFWFNEKKGWTVLIAVVVVGVAILVILLWLITSLLFRWRFQFSIRSLLVLTVAVAVPCSWMAVKMQQVERQREAVTAIKNMGGDGLYGWEVGGFSQPPEPPPGPEWLRRLLGKEFFASVTDVDLAEPRLGFDGLMYLKVPCPDAGLENLKEMPGLKWLRLDGSQVTDAGLKHVGSLSALETLEVANTGITDAGLKHLEGLTTLIALDLSGTRVTDAGLDSLKGLNKLERLSLGGTQVTDDGVKQLQHALPNCTIIR